ncbi:TetR/AcrR family transcriptional regulator [Sphingomonas sp. BN140010]|uniref:TetR/AcrR family transcriptional regulator n=1 Tax=Sphingomonas arvum TaxID=2992113 RepID=A0ABT3JBS0_9SPHN|nr:TetR/AcrR family transcriptional regulator [Sphingomonas sp. BN140010]MCW3796497.1 TetR/AcrR family transcriptional regulator [Sphingomonas sp. BN140010]
MNAKAVLESAPKSRGGRPPAEAAALIAERILGAAWTIVLEHGPDGLSFDRLAVVAGAGKATIYARFPSKVELARAILEHRLRSFEQQFESDIPMGETLEEELALLAERVASLMTASEGRALERMIDWLDLADPIVGEEARDWLYGRSTEMIAHHLTQIASKWCVPVKQPEFIAQLWLESVFGHARMRRKTDDAFDWARRHARVFKRALALAQD